MFKPLNKQYLELRRIAYKQLLIKKRDFKLIINFLLIIRNQQFFKSNYKACNVKANKFAY